MNYRKRSFRSFSMFDDRMNVHQVSRNLGISYNEASELHRLYLQKWADPKTAPDYENPEITGWYTEKLCSLGKYGVEPLTVKDADARIRGTFRMTVGFYKKSADTCIEILVIDVVRNKFFPWADRTPCPILSRILQLHANPSRHDFN